MVSATMTQVAPDHSRTRNDFVQGIIDAMLLGNWDKVRAISLAGISDSTQHFDDGSVTYGDTVARAADNVATNAAYYAGKHADLKGLAKKAYLGLVAAAELQMATAHVVKTIATGRIERITHPELSATGVCPRCKELEGLHNSDDNDLYWNHPNCCCEWRPERIVVSSHADLTNTADKADNQYRQASRVIGRGTDMDSVRLAEVVKFKDYDKATREEFVKKGWALPDKESGGAFPIADKADLTDALHRIGTTNHPRAQVVAFIRKRAKELGAEDMLGEKTAPPASHGVTIHMKDTAVFSNRQVTQDGMVVRRGKVFEAGSRMDMHGIPFVTTPEDLNRMVLNFKPIPVGSGHPEAPSPLDGHMGTVTNLYLGNNPNDLCAEVHIPPFINDILEAKNEGRVSMIFNRHTKEPLGLDFVSDPNVVDAALMASFARHRHDTPDGQKFMQNVHDACSKRGAVCTPPGKSAHASKHEASAVQQFHDIACEHGATCQPATSNAGFANSAKGFTMDWTAAFKGLFKAAQELDGETASFAGDDPENDFEADWQEERMGGMGPDATTELPDDYEANWNEDEADDGDEDDEFTDEGTDANPADNPAQGTGGEWSSNIMAKPTTNTSPEDAKFATVLQRNIQLEAELARERAHRIEGDAVHFADGEIEKLRSLPAEREMLIELYRQANADDAALGEIKLADGKVSCRTERLQALFSTRQEHWMTKEMLSTTLSPSVVSMAIESAHRFDETGVAKPMDEAMKAKYLNMTNLGKSTKKALDAAK